MISGFYKLLSAFVCPTCLSKARFVTSFFLKAFACPCGRRAVGKGQGKRRFPDKCKAQVSRNGVPSESKSATLAALTCQDVSKLSTASLLVRGLVDEACRTCSPRLHSHPASYLRTPRFRTHPSQGIPDQLRVDIFSGRHIAQLNCRLMFGHFNAE